MLRFFYKKNAVIDISALDIQQPPEDAQVFVFGKEIVTLRDRIKMGEENAGTDQSTK